MRTLRPVSTASSNISWIRPRARRDVGRQGAATSPIGANHLQRSFHVYLHLRSRGAKPLGVHEHTVRRYADRGLIGAVRLPSGVRRLRRSDVEAMQPGSPDEASPTVGGAVDSPTARLDDLVARASARPVSDLAALARPDLWDSNEDVDRFIAWTLAERDRDR